MNTPTPIATGDISVTIPIAVLDRSGKAVAGLTRDDISIFVDGVEVPVTAFEQERERLTMILVLDSSPSSKFRFKAVQQQASKLVSELPSDMKVMIADFSGSLNVRTPATTDRTVSLAGIKKIKTGSGTSLYSAIKSLYERAFPQVTGRKVVVLMTDGVDTTSEKTTFTESITEVEKEDVTIYSVYLDTLTDIKQSKVNNPSWIDQVVGQLPADQRPRGESEAEYKTGRLFLNELAAASGGRVFPGEKLDEATKSLIDELANRYYVTITVPRKNAGSRPVRVRVSRPGVWVSARGSFVEK